MKRTIGDTHNGLRIPWLTSSLIVAIATLSLAAPGQSLSPIGDTTNTSDSLRPRNTVVPLTVVNRFFPEVTQEASTGQNVTAVGKTKATRSVIYTNSDSSSETTSAYQEAVQKSKAVTGFRTISAPNLGENAFIGTVTQGEETHVGLGALDGTLIVGATLVGYDPTHRNIAKLLSLTREEEAAAKAVLNRTAHQ